MRLRLPKKSHHCLGRCDMDNARKYTDIPELTAEILHTFIRRVEVGERAEKYSRTAPQEIKIYYRDVGLVDDLPQSESKPEKTEKQNDSSTNEVA